ncbi:PLDc N-terminal domain-containing protein [Brevibacterium sp. 2SA]|uniref:PLDc N-terminal domain-containing protein n=1 Tax=Brevibacterium sp. 2SA TaxID=2502198 RepID=UPI0010F95F73|nr:PLDc N-terminal domain-containing protein [Brevibacterium sp. 2SA]
MARVLIAGIVLAAAITLYGLFDCLLRDRSLVRVLPKPVWALIILLIPIIGFVLWYIFGRGSEAKPDPSPRRSGPTAPDDDEDYLRQVDREVKLGKHRPRDDEPTDAETPPPGDTLDPEDRPNDQESGDEHGSEGTKGEGRGHSN